jgi:S-formylglutathione hydrolase FrmB
MKKFLFFMVILTAAVFSACAKNETVSLAGSIVIESITSNSLAASRTNENSTQPMLVYLPPSYETSKAFYPVVYYLHGFGGTYEEIRDSIAALDAAMEEGTVQECIIVGVSGRNTLNGSFYVNSSSIGNWEDYIVGEIPAFVDEGYRTLAAPASRGIIGFSMGGFGALNIGLKHPEVFGAVYALAPGVLADNGMSAAFATWDQEILTAYAAAFSPSTAAPYGDIPVFDGTLGDNEIIADWYDGFGNFDSKVAAYVSGSEKLKGIRIDYNSDDYYSWIPSGCIDLGKIFSAAGIDCELTARTGGHGEGMTELLRDSMLPFMERVLSY